MQTPNSIHPLATTRRLILVLSAVTGVSATQAQLGSFNTTATPNLPIPDNSTVGVAYDQVVSGVAGELLEVRVYLSISALNSDPMFNGDLYATLTHNSSQAILLNRVGRRDASSAGYGDSGFNVSLSDAAPAEIHEYRLTLSGSHLSPLSLTDQPGSLTGSWQPDGRNVDPESVTDSAPRTAGLAVFNGGDPNGTWTLFVADFAPGGQAKLNSWTLELTTVPEPWELSLVGATSLLLWSFWRRRP